MEPQDVTGAALCEGPEQATTLVELTVLLVGTARRRRTQLRALEAETGISKTTWSAWARGQRAAGRDRVAEVASRYDPDGAQAWLDAWDRLAAPAAPPAAPAPAVAAVPAPRRRVPAPAGVAVVVLGVLLAGATTDPAGPDAVPPVPSPASAAGVESGTAPTAAGLVGGPSSASVGDGVRVVAPRPGQAASGCVVVEGTGRADTGQVLVVSVRSWRGASASFRFAPVQYGAASDWQVRQPLPPTEGGDYEVLVVAVDARAARVEHDLNLATGGGWVAAELPLSARVLSAVRVRDDGTARPGCAG